MRSKTNILLLLTLCGCVAARNFNPRRSVDHDGHQHRHPALPVNIDWLNEDQRSQLDNADHDIIAQLSKLRNFYDQLADGSEPKMSAAKKIVHQCYGWLPKITNKEERETLKKLHHSDHNACKEKVNEYIGRLSEAEQTEIRKYWSFCEHVWYQSHVGHEEEHAGHSPNDHHSVPHHLPDQQQAPVTGTRRRREGHDHTGHTLEDYFNNNLSWLTDDQKESLRAMKAEGKSRSDIQQKVMEFYDATTGETRQQATELLKGGCRELLAIVIGAEKAQEVKKMKEAGASISELQNKVDEFIGAVTDDHKKEMAKEYGPGCKKIFTAAPAATRRRRAFRDENDIYAEQESQYRQQQDDNQDRERERGRDEWSPRGGEEGGPRRRDFDLTEHHSSWLNEEQRDQLRQAKEEGHDEPSIQNKVLEFFHVSPEDVKDMARSLLTSGCEKLLGKSFGEEKAEDLQRVRNTEGMEKMQQRMQEYAEEMEDEGQRAEALRSGSICAKISELLVRRRRTPSRWEREMDE